MDHTFLSRRKVRESLQSPDTIRYREQNGYPHSSNVVTDEQRFKSHVNVLSPRGDQEQHSLSYESYSYRPRDPNEFVKRRNPSVRGYPAYKTAHDLNQEQIVTGPPLASDVPKASQVQIIRKEEMHTAANTGQDTDVLQGDLIICDICKAEYSDEERIPRVLPCLHTFCQRCLEKQVRDWCIHCPYCKTRNCLPDDSVRNFPIENTRRNLRDFLHLKMKTKVQCRECPDGGHAGYFCKDCHSFMCIECKNAHMRNFISKYHNVVSVDEMQNTRLESFLRHPTCRVPDHQGQTIDFFCSNKGCYKAICKMCCVLEHEETKGHNVRKVTDVYADHKALIDDLNKTVGDRIVFSKNVMDDAEDEMKNLDKKYLEMSKKIDQEIDESIQMLEVRRRELKDVLKSKCKVKRAALQKQKDGLGHRVTMMSSAKDFASHIMSHAIPTELVALTDIIVARLSELKDQHIDSFPLENSFLTLDRDRMGSEFKTFAMGMGTIRSTAVYPPKTTVEVFDVPTDNMAEMMKLYLYDSKNVPQGSCCDFVRVEVKDPHGNVSEATVEDGKDKEGCCSVYFTATTLGQHRATVKVLGRLVNTDGYLFEAKSPEEIDKRFGNIICQGFTLDANTVHPEREVVADGRTLRCDVITVKKITARRLKRVKGRALPWDDPIRKQDMSKARPDHVLSQTHKDGYHNIEEKTFVGKHQNKYCGAIGTKPFHSPGRYYYEATARYRIHINLARNALLFEVGVARWEAIQGSIHLGAKAHAWSFSAERCNKHRRICHKFRHMKTLLLHMPISADTAGTSLTLQYGFFLDANNRQWTIMDVCNEKILFTFRNVDFSEPLWPVFGAYNPYSVYSEIHVRTGSAINKLPALLALV